MKKVIALALAMLMLVAVLAGCGGNSSSNNSSSGNNASAAPIELNMNVTTSESSVWQVAANTFKQLIEERTDGRYVVNIYPNEQLSSGDMPKGVENIFTGVTDLDIHSVMIMQSFEEKLTILTMPWLFTNGSGRERLPSAHQQRPRGHHARRHEGPEDPHPLQQHVYLPVQGPGR